MNFSHQWYISFLLFYFILFLFNIYIFFQSFSLSHGRWVRWELQDYWEVMDEDKPFMPKKKITNMSLCYLYDLSSLYYRNILLPFRSFNLFMIFFYHRYFSVFDILLSPISFKMSNMHRFLEIMNCWSMWWYFSKFRNF